MTLPRTDGFYYLASPYTHPDPNVREYRYNAVKGFAGALMQAGHFIYCPILNTHPIAVARALPVEFEWWEAFNRAFIERSEGVIVAEMDGWRTSRGVQHEIGLHSKVWLMSREGKFTAI